MQEQWIKELNQVFKFTIKVAKWLIKSDQQSNNPAKNSPPLRNEYGILLPKLFWPTVRKNCSSDREKKLKFEAEGREIANILRSLEQFVQTVHSGRSYY